MKRPVLLVTVATAGLLAMLIASCTGQGEGQRCQSDNNDDDCQSGLTCGPPRSGSGSNFQVCCPPLGQPVTEDLCRQGSTGPGSDAAINDSSASETSTSDAASESSTSDAASEASTDGSTTDATNDGSADATGQ